MSGNVSITRVLHWFHVALCTIDLCIFVSSKTLTQDLSAQFVEVHGAAYGTTILDEQVNLWQQIAECFLS